MIFQRRYQAYDRCDQFEDHRVMRTPPFDTVPRDADTGSSAVTTGLDDGQYVTAVPIPVTRNLVLTGQVRFETYCAPCHGVRGDGGSRVSVNMDLRKPPAIVGPLAEGLPPGRVYQVITEGYGLMRPYADDLPKPDQRWSVVAYLEALQKAFGVPLRLLPSELRRKAEEARP
jgi:mono/diheme cytochrome c family protein